ncbi:hypothetical protein GEMRC1_007730 [Eukaryota sp. GEM-RC1]
MDWPSNTEQRASALLRNVFGHTSWRSGQDEVIVSLLRSYNVLYNAPTSLGKSLPFQLCSLLMPGVSFICYPLVSLIQDQRAKLESLKISTGIIAPSLDPIQSTITLQALTNYSSSSSIKIVLTTPESLLSFKTKRLLQLLHNQSRLSFLHWTRLI